MPDLEGLRERVARLPRKPGVYQWKDAAGAILYVGKARDLRDRVASYLDPATAKGTRLLQDVSDVDYIAVRTEKEALLLEQTLIKLHRPRYNVRLTDDKQYPYLKLTNEPYPRLLKVHRREHDGATYFGPFPDGTGAFFVAQAILELVPLRRCKTLPRTKCLYYDIGKCAAPCIQACTDDQYDGLVAEVTDLLAGKQNQIVARVQGLLQQAVDAQRFEDAARWRDQLHGLKAVMERQHMVQDKLEERDIAAIESRGDLAVVVILHQRDGKVIGQSPFTISGVAAQEHAQPGEAVEAREDPGGLRREGEAREDPGVLRREGEAREDPGVLRREGEALAAFLRSYYQDRVVPRHLTLDAQADVGAALEADLRTLREGAVTVETPQKGGKMRWVEVAKTNARLRLEEEMHRRARRGAGAVEALQRALGLERLPRVIEGFDISHLAGQHTRAALVRFVDGEPDKAGYRTFNMRTVGEAAVAAGTAAAPSKGQGREVDDFASIGEAVQRRYRGVLEREEELPDLVLIDGGPGQLAAARSSLSSLGLGGVALCSLAKEEEVVYLPGRAFPLKLKRSEAALQLLQRVRDEAHRFGIRQVRSKSTQATIRSPLDDVPGIGPKRRAELVAAFGGLEGLRAASVDDLQRVKGVTPQVALAIQAALKQEAEPTQSAL